MDTKLVRSALKAFLLLNGEGDTTRLLLHTKKKFDQQNFPVEVDLTASVRVGTVILKNNYKRLECY